MLIQTITLWLSSQAPDNDHCQVIFFRS